ncbi:hypothetical protein [Xylophilus sp.]|uniref:hypothetical protein n=1 Tax=Xylophilus sp. TaxID=2653893 RepID=UPI0013BD923E|nr:hypothetical protein [Xylophilus sp.]KAF1049109.1 MAG: hypothetical protein GAK38_00876 [Xylophilus sp.]
MSNSNYSEAVSALGTLGAALAELRAGSMRIADFSQAARSQAGLLAALPPAFGEVLHGLLDRLEAGALFSEESCSFSQQDLLANLDLWLDKAGRRLARGVRTS